MDNAKSRGIPFEITIEYGWELFLSQGRKCALSGVPLVFAEKVGKYTDKTASLDRIDSRYGYIKGNVQWVHKDLNFMKHKHSTNTFVEWCRKVVDYQLTVNRLPALPDFVGE